jgi:hypothetical protein
MTIPHIRNKWLRRVALVFTVVAIIVCLGPLHLIQLTLGWVEDEFDVDLRNNWRCQQ